MTIFDFDSGRDNNFNLIRLLAALLVIYSHSYALVYGSGDYEPFKLSHGITLGNVAVDVFFITSGFLVSKSLLQKRSLIDFFSSRILRIYPGLLVMLIVVFFIAPIISSVGIIDFFQSEKTRQFFISNLSLIFGVKYELPGVFSSNPYSSVVNGSLWTMPYEVRCYCILAFMWLVSRVCCGGDRLFSVFVVTLLFILFSFFALGSLGVLKIFVRFLPIIHLFYMFFIGCFIFLVRSRVRLEASFFCFFVFVLILFFLFFRQWFLLVYCVVVFCILFYLAYVPSGFVREFNRLGDFSYGVYIYGFFVQQLIVFCFPGVTVVCLTVFSFLISILLGVASWYLIERRALMARDKVVSYLSSLSFR